MAETALPPSPRTQLHRHPERGHYDRTAIRAILDDGFICHVGFLDAAGYPVVIPTAYGRSDDSLYLHGSAVGRMLPRLGTGLDLCCTITHLDGLVLARSVFNHSMNYRSVMVFGRAVVVDGNDAKLLALEAISNQIAPGRWEAARLPSIQELNATLVLALPLEEASAKVRSGPPKDSNADYDLPIWAGVVPVQLVYGPPEPDPQLTPGIPRPQPLLRGRVT